MIRLTLASIAICAACLPPPSPEQQIQDGERAVACVVRDWGQPIETIAKDCTGGVVQATIDIIADVGFLLGPDARNPYANDPRVQTSMRARFTSGDAGLAPAKGAGPAGPPAASTR